MKPGTRLIALSTAAVGLWLARGQFVATDEVVGASAPTRRPGAAAPGPVAGAQPGSLPADAAALPLRTALARERVDPFASPRMAVKAPPPAPPPPVASPPPRPPAPAPTPRVPYRLVGLLSEPGKPPSVYLALGDKLIDARPGDVLEGGYQLQSITAKQLNFLHQQSNQTVYLTVDGDPL